jgi:hypothetical protein
MADEQGISDEEIEQMALILARAQQFSPESAERLGHRLL